MFGVMVANVLHRRAHVRHASMENMRSLPSLRALERRASMLIRMKNMIWQSPINSEQGVSYWACAMAPWPKIRFSGFGYWKAPLLPLRPLRKDFSNELGPTYVEALTFLGCQKMVMVMATAIFVHHGILALICCKLSRHRWTKMRRVLSLRRVSMLIKM